MKLGLKEKAADAMDFAKLKKGGAKRSDRHFYSNLHNEISYRNRRSVGGLSSRADWLREKSGSKRCSQRRLPSLDVALSRGDLSRSFHRYVVLSAFQENL